MLPCSTNGTRLTTFTLILFCYAAPAQAAPKLSAAGAERLAQVQALLDQIPVDPAWARGEITDKNEAAGQLKGHNGTLKRAKGLFDTLGFWDQKTPEAKAVAGTLKARAKYLAAVQQAVAGPSAAPAQGEAEPDPSSASRAGQQLIRNMKANFRDVDPGDPLCQGDLSAADKRKAQTLHTTLEANLGFARTNADRLKAADRAHPAVAFYLKRLDALTACHKALGRGLDGLKTAGAQTKARYFAFMGDASAYQRTIDSLVYFAVDINDKVRRTSHPEQLQQWKTHLDAVHALCTGKYSGVKNDPRYGTSNARNPEMWCKTAALRDAIIRRLVANQVSSAVAQITERLRKAAAEFETYDGYIRIDSVREVKALNEPAAFKAEVNDKHEALYRAANMEPDASVWRDFDAAHGALWAKIDRLAPTWKRPARAGGGPGAAAAKKRLLGARKGNRVIAAYITRASWQVIKNALGVPLRRTKPGYVVYREKGAKWCIGRSFTYAEEYIGRSFKPSREISELGFIRHEKCN